MTKNEQTPTSNGANHNRLQHAKSVPQRLFEKATARDDMRRSLATGSTMRFRIPTKHDAETHTHATHGAESWRASLLRILHSPAVEYGVMALLALDVLMLFVEVFLLAMYPPCHTIVRDAISCCPAVSVSNSTSQEEVHESFFRRFLEESHGSSDHSSAHHSGESDHHSSSHHHSVCTWGVEASYEAGCDEHKWSRVHNAEHVLFIMTIVILVLFLVEQIALMAALTPAIYARQFFFLLDFVVITVSLAMELTFHSLDDDVITSFLGFLVLVRVWRFVRIGHGIVEVTHKLSEQEHHKLVHYAEKLEKALVENGIEVPQPDENEAEDEHH